MSQLPDEVLDRLSLGKPVRFTAWNGEDMVTLQASVAPLHRQLYVLVPLGGEMEAALLSDGRAEISAESKEENWNLRVTGRAVAGRSASGDPRRSELVHWLPENQNPNRLLAVRFLAEQMDYSRSQGNDRTRAAGPVPGRKVPSPAARWTRMAIRGTLGWVPVMGLTLWGGLLTWADPPYRTFTVLTLMILVSVSLYGGVGLLGRYTSFLRWREGLVKEEEVPEFMRGWLPPRQVFRVGAALVVLGEFSLPLLWLLLSREVALLSFFASGVWIWAPWHVVRYLFRRSDAAVEG